MLTLPFEIIDKICRTLGIAAAAPIDVNISTHHKAIIEHRRRSRLAAVFANPSQKLFLCLLDLVTKDVNQAPTILKDKMCKNVLINYRPKDLPHWVLSLAEEQPELVEVILTDDEYVESLQLDELLYLTRNYPQLNALVEKVFEQKAIEMDEKQLAIFR